MKMKFKNIKMNVTWKLTIIECLVSKCLYSVYTSTGFGAIETRPSIFLNSKWLQYDL